MASEEVDLSPSDADGGGGELELIHVTTLETQEGAASEPASAAVLAAIGAVAIASPEAISAIRMAAEMGNSLRVAFNPKVMAGLREGSLGLLQTHNGAMATAVDGSGAFVANARVVGDVTANAGGRAALMMTGAMALPIALAALAAYQQQVRLEKALKAVQKSLDRIEERLKAEEHGVCDAAEQFIELAAEVSRRGPLPPYLRAELAAYRVRVESLYGARRRYVRQFKAELERQQVAWELKKGERQPWVDNVEELARGGKLEEELILFVRTLLAQYRLDAFAALCLAEEGYPDLSMRMLHESALELRSEFFDLHNRLRPLAKIAPPKSLRDHVPGLSRHLEHAHEVTRLLVAQLDEHVLPSIPNPHLEEQIVIDLSADDVQELAAGEGLLTA